VGEWEVAIVGIGRLDDQDYRRSPWARPRSCFQVQPAFLRGLDGAEVVHPTRSAGRAPALLGMTLEAAGRIVELDDELGAARRRITELENRPRRRG
jgi:hypothetical protein